MSNTPQLDELPLSRFKAMAHHCRANPEQIVRLMEALTPFAVQAESIGRQVDRRREQIEKLLQQAKTPPCTVREGFAIPDLPCRKCGARSTPEAYFDVDDVSLAMVCKPCGEEYVGELPWPFNEERAYWSDFEALGIAVES